MKDYIPCFVHLVLVTLLALAPLTASAQSDTRRAAGLSAAQAAEERARTFSELRDKAALEPTVRVILGLDVPFRREAGLTPAETAAQRQALAAAQADLVASLDAPVDVTTYRFIPFAAMEVDRADLERLQASPLVVSVMEDVAEAPSEVAMPIPLHQSVPLIGADVAWGLGYAGAGWSVAILDTGVDADHPFLAGKVVAEACFSTTNSTATSVCPNGQNTQIGPGAGADCDAGVDGCDHGTHVAGIAAGAGTAFSGVARDASVIAVQVFSEFPGSQCTYGTPCVKSYVSDQIEGLEYVYSLRNTHDVAAANMSLGGGYYTSTCDGSQAPRKAALDQLLGAGIATAISSGNDGYPNATGAPGCISTAVTVGSTTKSDGVSYFSNVAPWMDVFAPGSAIQSSVPGGGFASWNGTSMAAPHVAGALAILRQAHPAESAEELVDRLTSTGVPVVGGSPVQAYPRIQVDAALGPAGAPDISVAPAAITESLPAGAGSTQTLTIENTGTSALTFGVGFVAGATSARLEPSPQRDKRARAMREPMARRPNGRAPTAPLPRAGSEEIDDGSFEAGTPNPFWDEFSSNFGTPLCDLAFCGSSFPNTGSWWAWFGGTSDAETGSLGQEVVIPAGAAELSFSLQVVAEAPGYIEVRIDGDQIFYADQSDGGAYATYTPVTLDVSLYADGQPHDLLFYYESPAGGNANILVDDVSLTAEPTGPAWLAVAPTSGTVDPGSSASLTLSFDAAGLAAGTYTTTLAISSNDPDTPVVEVPVTLTVDAVNQPPLANDDAASTDEDEPVVLDVLANDSDPGGDPLSLSAVSEPSHGTAAIASDVITYTPDADFFGEDTFTYTITDGMDEATASVSVTVDPVNDAPVFESEPVTSVVEGELYLYDIEASDVEDDGLTITASGVPAWLSFIDGGDGSATLTGTPAFGDDGSYPLTLTASDGDLDTEQAFTITVGAVNQPPAAADDEATTDEDAPVTIDVLANDADPDGDDLELTTVTEPTHGTAEVEEGLVTYSPDEDYSGEDTFTYTISDGAEEATATVTVTVEPVNDAPTAAVITAPEDGAVIELEADSDAVVEVAWSASVDVDGDAVSYRWEAVLGEGDFSAPLLTFETDGTSLEAAHAEIDAALAEAGIELGASATVEHRIIASDQEVQTAGPVASLTIRRVLSTDAESGAAPTVFAALGAYPNPSSGSPRIAVDLPWPADVKVEIYDTAGRQVAVQTQTLQAGSRRVVSMSSLTLTTGVYIYRLTAVAPSVTETTTGRFTVLR